MLLARARRLGVVSRHARTVANGPANTALQGIIAGLAGAQPPLSTAPDLSTPPVGTQHPPPKASGRSENALDKNILQKYVIKIPRYSLYCQSTRNNTITTLMSHDFHPLASFSGGICNFKKVNRSGYEAGYQCAVQMFRAMEKLLKENFFEVDLYFKGFGQGRDAMHKALLTSEGDRVRPVIKTITDRTPIKIGGTRSKKARRL